MQASSATAYYVFCKVCSRAICLIVDLTKPLIVYAAASAGSLSLLATGIDSVFDAGSNALLFWLHRKAQNLNVNKWPVGGARLETIGNIIYGKCYVVSTRYTSSHYFPGFL
jgi:divalent metal cation (Fe/Co/Zn/Cd) transporter